MGAKVEEKTVTVKLFRDKGEYKDPMFVGVNMKTYTIPRGIPVEVPESVAEVLRNSQEQDEYALSIQEELQRNGDWDEKK